MFDDLKIVYLEDEPIVALDTSDQLRDLGFCEVKVASRLNDAVAFTAEDDFDLALLDINVDKGQTSLELGHQLASRGTKVIFATGNSSVGSKACRDGIYLLDKPFSAKQLKSILKKAAQQ